MDIFKDTEILIQQIKYLIGLVHIQHKVMEKVVIQIVSMISRVVV